MDSTTRSQERACVLAAVALFAVLVVVHAVLGDFPKAIDVLPDERRYLDTARSLFSGNGLIIRGEASSFQKILYPVSLFPALLFDDGQAQIRAMGVLNSIYAASAVFPTLAIARKLFDSPRSVVASLVLVAVTPDLMYSMTFMTEALFMPFALWTAYLCWRCFEARGRRQVVLAACAGALVYACYLCKEVALMYVIAFLAWVVVAAVRKRCSRRQALACVGAFVLGFVVPFAVLKFTLFAGLGNSYSQFSFDILLSPYTVLFGLYSIAIDSVHFIVAFGVFPILFCALAYRSASREERDLLFFCLVSLVVGLAVVVFTISMREDVGHVELRQHIRYVAPLIVVLTMLFARLAWHFDPRSVLGSRRRRDALVASVAVFCVLACLLFGVANFRQGFDFAQFHGLRWLLDNVAGDIDPQYYNWSAGGLKDIDDSDGALLEISWLIALVRVGIVAFTVGGFALLLSRKERLRRVGVSGICVVLGICMVLNSVALYRYDRNAYGVDQSDIDEICAVSDELASLVASGEVAGDGAVVVLLDDSNTGPNNLIDTYLSDGAGNYDYLKMDAFEKRLQKDVGAEALAYLLVNKSQKPPIDDFDATVALGDDDSRFKLYRIEHES